MKIKIVVLIIKELYYQCPELFIADMDKIDWGEKVGSLNSYIIGELVGENLEYWFIANERRGIGTSNERLDRVQKISKDVVLSTNITEVEVN